MAKLSVLLPTYNEANILIECLETIKWADEILVVDSYSTDSTLDIASLYNARVIQHEYITYVKQKNWAIPQCKNEWVLQIDADERLEEALQADIQEIMRNPPNDVDGYRMPFKHHVLGRWVRNMNLYPEYHLRLFRRDVGHFQDKEVDAHVAVPGEVVTLNNHFLHFGVESISQRLLPLDRYTCYEADEREKQGRQFHWVDFIGRPIAAFLFYFFLKQGFRDGFRGVILSALKADFLFWTYAKLWEKEWRQETEK